MQCHYSKYYMVLGIGNPLRDARTSNHGLVYSLNPTNILAMALLSESHFFPEGKRISQPGNATGKTLAMAVLVYAHWQCSRLKSFAVSVTYSKLSANANAWVCSGWNPDIQSVASAHPAGTPLVHGRGLDTASCMVMYLWHCRNPAAQRFTRLGGAPSRFSSSAKGRRGSSLKQRFKSST